MKLIIALVASAAAVFTFSVATQAFGKDSAELGPKIRISAGIPSIDWHATLDLASLRVILNVMDGLTSFNADGKLVPALAEKWSSSNDQKTFKFQIRKGVVWSDGVPLTAQHCADGILRVLNPKTGAIGASHFEIIQGAKEYIKGKTDVSQVGVRALDPHTLEIKLETPARYLPALLAHNVGLPARIDLINKHGDKWTRPENLVGLGPYKLETWKEELITLVANEKYYGVKPAIKKFSFRVVHDDSTALDLFRMGELDILYNPPRSEWGTLRTKPDFQIFDNIRVLSMTFNVKKAPFDNVKVRQAFSLATDREGLVKILDLGKANGPAIYRALSSWIPDGVPSFNSKIGLKYAPELAKQRLSEAGFPGGKGFPAISLAIDSREEHKLVAERLQAQWLGTLGVKIDIETRDPMGHLGKLRSDAPQVFRFGIGAVFLDPDLFARIFMTVAGLNYAGWNSPKYEKIVTMAAGETNGKKRNALYDSAQKILIEDDAVMIPISQEALPMMIADHIKGLKLTVRAFRS